MGLIASNSGTLVLHLGQQQELQGDWGVTEFGVVLFRSLDWPEWGSKQRKKYYLPIFQYIL